MQAAVDLIRELETISLNALPALETIELDGWLLRFANGYTGRANSVQTSDHGSVSIDKKIPACEAAYASRGLQALFKLTAASLPAELDGELERRGYTIRTPVSIQTRRIESTTSPPGVVVDSKLTREWLVAFSLLSGLAPERLNTFERLIGSITLPKCFASRIVAGEIVGVGMCVAESGWAGLFDVVTSEAHRRQGHATAVIDSLLDWANQKGAERAYLQVTKANFEAVSLYQQLGFKEAYTYWYREKAL